MPKEKETILFSRNSIRIKKTNNIDFSKRREQPYTLSVVENTTYEKQAPSSGHYKNSEWVEITKQSKLGFYYKSKEYHSGGYVGEIKNKKGLTVKTITVNLSTEQYQLSYPTGYADGHINIEERPWDIAPGSKGMPDHMITALVKETEKFFDVIFDNKISISQKKTWYNKEEKTINTKELRKQTFIDLFGYEDGPKEQPNNIKILAHGFDLKESFRKRKETK